MACIISWCSLPKSTYLPFLLSSKFPLIIHYIGSLTFINDKAKAALLVIFTKVGAMFTIFIKPLWRNNNLKYRIHDRHLEFAIWLGSGWEGRWGVDLDQPRLQIIFNQNIVPIHFKAMLIINDHRLYTFKWDIYYILDFVEAFVCSHFATSLFEIKPKILNAPLATMLLIVIIVLFLDGNVSEMNHHVISIWYIWAVFFITETSEAKGAQPYFHGSITCNKYIYSQIKFLRTNKQWFVNISANNVGLLVHLRLEGKFTSVSPFLNLLQLIDEENTLSLSSTCRLHNPSCIWVLFKFLNKYSIIAW